MADNKKVQEELKKLEDQAYFELCQIIAEAMQYQDVELLNVRIASWKTKYKKLLDRPSTNSKSDFKKRIEFLLTQYYSEVTKYILSQLKLNEEKKVENQSKALRELYTIIRDTNDYDLLKKKVNKWKDKYPISGFLKMYQKRIELYTRDKSLRENSFKQEEAFRDLVDVTKVHGTLDELKNELTLWEEKYSINDKYSIDDFLKHQSEVKRYTSDEFLQSIAREEFNPDNIDKNDIDIVDEYNNKSFSNLSIQASAYAALLKISKSPNAVNEMFTWVYKNRGIKFNDKYKELILSATYLNYSPTYLNKLVKPKIDMSKSSLSFDEYRNINDIKKYAIISYFNLLLPPEKAIANDYFNEHIQTIYAKSERARVSDVKEETIPLDSGIEISFKKPMEEDTTSYAAEIDSEPIELVTDEVVENTTESVQPEIVSSPNIETVADTKESDSEEISIKEEIDNGALEIKFTSESDIVIDLSNTEPELTINLNQPEEDKSEPNEITQEIESDKADDSAAIQNIATSEEVGIPDDKNVSEKSLNHPTIVAISPLFFEEINNYNKQAILINHIDSTATKYIETEKAKEASLDEPIKTKTDEN